MIEGFSSCPNRSYRRYSSKEQTKTTKILTRSLIVSSRYHISQIQGSHVILGHQTTVVVATRLQPNKHGGCSSIYDYCPGRSHLALPTNPTPLAPLPPPPPPPSCQLGFFSASDTSLSCSTYSHIQIKSHRKSDTSRKPASSPAIHPSQPRILEGQFIGDLQQGPAPYSTFLHGRQTPGGTHPHPSTTIAPQTLHQQPAVLRNSAVTDKSAKITNSGHRRHARLTSYFSCGSSSNDWNCLVQSFFIFCAFVTIGGHTSTILSSISTGERREVAPRRPNICFLFNVFRCWWTAAIAVQFLFH